jgi:Gram-negative bacterial TonB protein C-terminal
MLPDQGGTMLFFRILRSLPVCVLAACIIPVNAQDMNVRVEAVRLMERAIAVSSSTQPLPDYRQDITFRTYAPDGAVKDGTYSTIFSGQIERSEISYGDFHIVTLQRPENTLKSTTAPPPVEYWQLMKLIPVSTGRFDKSDVIHSITADRIADRPAKCIHFETINGKAHQSNEICVDAERETVLRWNVGDELIEDSQFSIFQGSWLPGRIRHYVSGKLRMEIQQTFVLMEGPIDFDALAPENPIMYTQCQRYNRALVQSAPQPENAGAGPWYDVKIHGTIGKDGRVHDAAVVAAGRPELEQQALQIVSKWLFNPATCDGRAISDLAAFTVHFPPQ